MRGSQRFHALVGARVAVAPTLILISLLVGTEAAAQQPGSGTTPLAALCARDLTAGSSAERSLLNAALLSRANISTLLRPLTPADAGVLLGDMTRSLGFSAERRCGGLWSPFVTQMWYNTSASHPDRDGAVWQGRGLTTSLTAGFAATKGPISVALQPLAMFTENRPFTARPIAQINSGDFRDPAYGAAIDLPYRFGTRPYATIDPGESYVRLEYRRIALGATTQSQQWGPAHFYPLVIGNEAAGFPRIFAEGRRVPVGIGHLTAHWQLGLLEASPYSMLPSGERSRIASAFTGSFSPKSLPGLELGGARFFHVRRSPGVLKLSTATLPFSGLLKSQSRDAAVGGFNQLASLFFRIAPAGAGVEAYGEFYREDHNANLRDLIGEPDHESAYTLGLRRVWKRDTEATALTIEHANGRSSHIARIRSQSPIYIHSSIAEGHTYGGQPLGSSAVLGGGGTSVSWNRVGFQRSLDLTIEVKPNVQKTEGGSWNGRNGGVCMFHVNQARVIGGKIYGASLGLQFGYGFAQRSNVTMGVSLTE